MDTIPQKRCPKCGQTKPATPQHFRRNRTKKSRLSSHCKECLQAQEEKTRISSQQPKKPRKKRDSSTYRPQRKTIREDGTVQCSCCKRWKPAISEYFSRREDTSVKLNPRCKQCIKEARLIRIQAHPVVPRSRLKQKTTHSEPFRTCTKCHKTKPATVEFFAIDKRNGMQMRCRVCINAQKQQYNTEHHEQRLEAARQRRKRNPEDHRTRNRNRKAQQKSIPGKHTKEDIRIQYDRQKGKCYWCGKRIEWTEHTVDHIIPVTREGTSNDPWNLVIACKFCNISKKNRLPHEWNRSGGRLL